MSQQHQAQLQEAYQLIKSGSKQEATRILLGVLRENRDNADAWWLLANATSDPEKQRQALGQVLRIKPDHNSAQRMLEKVNAAPAVRPAAPPPEPPRADPFAAPSSSRAAAPADDPFGDPFGSSSTRIGSRPVADDPFGDPFAASSRTPAPADDPFGDPFSSASTRSTRPVADDPFGDPFAASSRTPAPASDPFGDPFAASARSRASDDPFGQPRGRAMSDDPFAGARGSALPDRPPVVQKKGTNPLVIILAIIGIVVVLGCGLAALAGVAGLNVFNQAIQTAMPEGTFQAAMQDLQNAMTALPGGTFTADNNGIIGTVVEKGALGATPVRATLESDGFTNHAYKFTGEAGQNVTIELTALTADFDVKLTLLGPDESLVDMNDDIDFQNNNLNARITTTLPTNGAYTVIVSDVGFGGGDYELTLR
jgi:hypothetical protein